MSFKIEQRALDIYWTFILPSICFFSLTTNAISILVFNAIKSRNTIYKYMLANVVFDEVYLMCVFFIFIVRCGQFCQIKNTYFAQFYAHYIYMYTANSIALFSIFLEISILIQRFCTLKNKKIFKNINKKFIFFSLFTFSFIYYVPQLSTFEIKQKNQSLSSSLSEIVYVRENVTPNKSFFIKNIFAIHTAIRLALIVVMIVFLNKLSRFLFKKYEAINLNFGIQLKHSKIETTQTQASERDSSDVNRSEQISSIENTRNNTRLIKSKRNVTKMVVFTSLIFLIGNIFTPILYFLFYVLNLKFEGHWVVITLISNSLQFGSYGFNTFVFYSFNNKYRLICRRMFLVKK